AIPEGTTMHRSIPDYCPTCERQRSIRLIPGGPGQSDYPEVITLGAHCSCPGGPAHSLRRDCKLLAAEADTSRFNAKLLLRCAREARDRRHDLALCRERVRQARRYWHWSLDA